MMLLALDTSSDACSVALGVDDRVLHRHVVEARAHTRILIPMIEEILREAGATIADLDALVLGNGPGSFIGMRIGTSVAQGIAFGAGLQIVPLSSLLVVAAESFERCAAERVIVAQDARMGEVYLQTFERCPVGSLSGTGPVRLHPAATAVPGVAEADVAIAGAGWCRYPQLLAGTGFTTEDVEVLLPDARWLLPAGRSALADGHGVAADAVAPEYVRMKVARIPGADGGRSGDGA